MSLRSRHIVFIHGMAGWGPKDFGGRVSYWGEALAQFGPALAPHVAKCGPFSALHDRACEVFAEIIGARVDYGEKHSREAGHARYARDFSGQAFVPGWSAENPVILVGHSAGALTALKLQKLLANDFWGVGSRADWIEVVVSVAGALNGSLLVAQNWRVRAGVLFDLDKYKYDREVWRNAYAAAQVASAALPAYPNTGPFQTASTSFGINYTDECTVFDVSYTQSYADRQAGATKDTRTIMFRLELRTLGEVSYSQNLGTASTNDGISSSN